MTYEAKELSVEDGAIVELYTFKIGSFIWNFNNSDHPVTVNGIMYSSTQISRTSIKNNQDISNAAITITVPFDNMFAKEYLDSPPSQEATLKVATIHETDTVKQMVIDWIGRVASVKFKDDVYVDIRCETITTTLRRTLLRRNYQRQCPHLLYGSQCTVDRDDYSFVTPSFFFDGTFMVTAGMSDFGPNFFDGGYVEFDQEGFPLQRRFITITYPDIIVLDLAINLRAGVPVTATLFAGCDHTMTTCKSRFSNLDNFGGMPYIPTKNPLNGTAIF